MAMMIMCEDPKRFVLNFFHFTNFLKNICFVFLNFFLFVFTKVAALQGKKVISIATGSLHCVACTDSGEVFTWGDNDEGQLGDGSTNAIQRPRLVAALQVNKN